MSKPEKISIDGVDYVRSDLQPKPAVNKDGLEYVIVRNSKLGNHAGYLLSEDGTGVVLVESRWIWYWKGALTINELANVGTTDVANCKFTAPVRKVKLTAAANEPNQIVYTTEAGAKSIQGAPTWKK